MRHIGYLGQGHTSGLELSFKTRPLDAKGQSVLSGLVLTMAP